MLLTRGENQPARREGRPLREVGTQPCPAREVALRTQQTRRLGLDLARVEPGRGIVVDDEECVLEDEGAPLQLVRGGGPCPRQARPIEVAEVGQGERREGGRGGSTTTRRLTSG